MSQFVPPPMPPQPPPLPPNVVKRRTPMLQWPTIFPLAVFIAAQVCYGWPEAKVSASSSEYAISYLMGGIMGGLLLSYIVAWITFRLSGRSSNAATIAFSAAMLLLSGTVYQKGVDFKKGGSLANSDGRPPTAHLAFRDKPIRALGNKIILNYPAIATASETENKSVIIRISDFKKRTQMEATVQLVNLANPDSFEVVRDRMGKSVVQRLTLPEAAVWHEMSGPTRRALTQAIPSADKTHRTIFALIDLEPKRMIVITFLIFTDQTQEQAAYATMAEKVVESIKPAP